MNESYFRFECGKIGDHLSWATAYRESVGLTTDFTIQSNRILMCCLTFDEGNDVQQLNSNLQPLDQVAKHSHKQHQQFRKQKWKMKIR